ncbi:MAG: glucose-6-phosphate isomerase [candidate division Zixibacteria bacterium]|nr:glucose-6-phosphate isomerase [candidate division Zixibacteria bacterium]
MPVLSEENATITRHRDSVTAPRTLTPDDAFVKANQIALNITHIVNPIDGKPFISVDEIERFAPTVVEQHHRLKNGEGDCRDGDTPMLGWQSLPDEISTEHLDEILSVTGELSGQIDAFVSLGIGGSYLGIDATIKALTHTYFNQLPREARNGAPEIYFLGQSTDPDYFRDTLDMLEGKRVGLNVISKSGTTTETAIAFRILRRMLEDRHPGKIAELIIATTDSTKGALRSLVKRFGYKSFEVPGNVGGRFSVLTDVGLVGLAMAGIDIHEFTAGFRHMKKRTDGDDFWSNLSMVHAAVRHLAHQKGKKIEVVATNSAAIYQLTRWMEQIFPESEGHGGFGMWVSPSMYSEKLHANGQMVQDGERNILETFLRLVESNNDIEIPVDPDNEDGLNYFPDAGHTMSFINSLVIDGPAFAHFEGGVPNMTVDIPRRNAFNLGQFYYMMERSVALSGYLAGHNPFIQPGVEAYKRAMFSLAGKPGWENDGKAIKSAIGKMKLKVI